jgi:hypothetical protein
LVKRVFERYRTRVKHAADLLNDEYFITSIDRLPDSEMRHLSANPLFLTIMCFVYVHAVLDTRHLEVTWATRSDALIDTCIDLLLKDLDAEKVRQLSPAARAGLQSRRNEYVAEKAAFLAYFAADCFLNARAVFPESLLVEEAVRFLRNAYGSRMDAVIQELESGGSGRATFCRQLIYAGIFVIVNIRGGTPLYDFPHRRFREALAVRYFTSNVSKCVNLLNLLRRRDLSELWNILRVNPQYQHPAFQRALLAEMGARAACTNGEDLGVASQSLVEASVDRTQHAGTILELIETALRLDGSLGRLAAALLDSVPEGARSVNRMEDAVRKALATENAARLCVGMNVLEKWSPAKLSELLVNCVDEPRLNADISVVVLRFATKWRADLVEVLLARIAAESDGMLTAAFALATERDGAELVDRYIWKRMSRSDQVALFGLLWKHSRPEFEGSAKRLAFDLPSRVYEQADVLLRATEIYNPLAAQEQVTYVVSYAAYNEIRSWFERGRTVFLRILPEAQRRKDRIVNDVVERDDGRRYADVTGRLAEMWEGLDVQLMRHMGSIVDRAFVASLTSRVAAAGMEASERASFVEDRTIEEILKTSGQLVEPSEWCHSVVQRIEGALKVDWRQVRELFKAEALSRPLNRVPGRLFD